LSSQFSLLQVINNVTSFNFVVHLL
jgi:hypothetical protein